MGHKRTQEMFHVPLFERFELHVERIPFLTCWVWNSSADNENYGRIRADGGKLLLSAHRVAYEKYKDLIPEGMTIDHLCKNKWCVNPRHLEAVTPKENILRGNSPSALCARKMHCPQGHFYSKANTRHYKGMRRCRICTRNYNREQYLRIHGT